MKTTSHQDLCFLCVMSASESHQAPLQPSGGTQNYKTHIDIKSQEKKIMKYVCVVNIECLTKVLPKFTDAITSIRHTYEDQTQTLPDDNSQFSQVIFTKYQGRYKISLETLLEITRFQRGEHV